MDVEGLDQEYDTSAVVVVILGEGLMLVCGTYEVVVVEDGDRSSVVGVRRLELDNVDLAAADSKGLSIGARIRYDACCF